MGLLADKVGRQNTMCISVSLAHSDDDTTHIELQVILSAVTVISLWYNAAPARFIAFVVLYGIYAGGYNALVPVIVTEIYGTQNYASVNGMLYFVRHQLSFSLPLLKSSTFLDQRNGRYHRSTSRRCHSWEP